MVDRWKIGWPDRIDWTLSRGGDGSLAPSTLPVWRTRGNKLLSIVAIIRRCVAFAAESLPVILGGPIKTQYTGSRASPSTQSEILELIENELRFSASASRVIRVLLGPGSFVAIVRRGSSKRSHRSFRSNHVRFATD